jgi:hypothetical protein
MSTFVNITHLCLNGQFFLFLCFSISVKSAKKDPPGKARGFNDGLMSGKFISRQ